MITSIRKHAGIATAALLLGTGLALAPAAYAAPAQDSAAAAAAAGRSAGSCYFDAKIGFYCGYHKGTKYADRGDSGNHVKEIQKLINDTAFGPGKPAKLSVDGKFGPKTEQAVRWFQKTFMGASQADGIVGPKTWKELRWG